MEFIPDIVLTLTYAAVIPIYGLFIFALIAKKNKKERTSSDTEKVSLKKAKHAI